MWEWLFIFVSNNVVKQLYGQLYYLLTIMASSKTKRKASIIGGVAFDLHEDMEIMPLGAGNEVGRSCIILKFRGKTIMV